jgi:1-acyl-sn-glycerol-3-phosphate acyltransferase
MEERATRAEDPMLRAARRLGGLAARWHRAELAGAHRLPAGPALLVGNHGLFGWETVAFFWLVHRATGRMPKGLADRVVFGNPVVRPLLERIGGHVGTRQAALRLLGEGELVVCYPGGAREVFKAPGERYRLRWEGRVGFARVAIDAGAPIVPFAALGVDDSWLNLGHLRAARAVLGRYAAPLALGLGPLPLPARFKFVLGRPVLPPADPALAPRLKASVERAVYQLLASRGAHAVPADPARVVP